GLLGIAPFGHDPDGDVSVRERPHEPVGFHDRRQPDVFVTHHLRRVRNGLVRVDRARVFCHELPNRSHENPSSLSLGTVTVTPSDAAQTIRALALSLPQSYEDEPWGHPVFKVGDNRMFASMW